MKIVIAPDSFKESLSATEVCQCIETGFRDVYPNAHYHHLPLADGGEGTLDVILAGVQGEKRFNTVKGPMGQPVKASWALLEQGKTAVIEVAEAAGLHLVPQLERNPELATTFGVGELINAALNEGVSKIIIGLGGSATNDGGAGIIQALGGRLLDASGQDLAPGALALHALHSLDLSAVNPRCASVEIVLMCDVNNPLTGAQGASQVFAPQKGANPQQVSMLDDALVHFARVVERVSGVDYTGRTGFGAAGGLPLGLSVLFATQLHSGIGMVLDLLHAEHVLTDADLVITGEGKMDNQTLQGKAPFGIAQRAKMAGIPVIGLAGSLGESVDALDEYMDALFGTVRAPQELAVALKEARHNLIRTARNLARMLKLGETLAGRHG